MNFSKKTFLLAAITALILAFMFAGLKGWSGIVVPNLGKVGQFSIPVLVGFSFLAGIVSFFAPCAFALFPGYIAFYLGSRKEGLENPAKLGAMASLGVITFFIFLSVFIIIVGKSVARSFGYFSPLIGFVIILLGLAMFSGYSFKTGMVQRLINKIRSREKRSKRNIFLFGFGYGAVSLGCTLPLLFAMIIVPLSAGKVFTVILSLAVYSTAMSLLMIFVTYLVAWSEHKIIAKMVRSTATIKKLSGTILIAIGAYLVYYNLAYNMLLG